MYQNISVITGGYTVYSTHPFDVTFTDGNLSLATFVRKINQFNGYQNYMLNVSMADIDGDGLADIIVPLHGTVLSDVTYFDSFAVYRNTTVNGIVSFASRVTFKTTGSYTSNLTTGDFDGDGKLDVAVTNQRFVAGGSINVFRNTSVPGSISFSAPISLISGDYPTQIVTGDIDGDGKTDMAVASAGAYFYVYKNTSDGATISFDASPQIPIVNAGALSICISDVDGDGKPDVLTSDNIRDSIAIFRNISTIGTISFADPNYYNAGRKTSFVNSGDMDGDGKNDLVLGSGYFSFAGVPFEDSSIVLARNLSSPGTFSFTAPVNFTVNYPSNVLLTDFDGDGKPDIVSANNNNRFAVFKNTSNVGNISLAPKIDYTTAGNFQAQGVIAGDVDGDGKPDIITSDQNTASVSVFINQNGSDAELCPLGNKTLFSNISGSLYQWQVNMGSGYVTISNGTNYSGTNASALNLISIPSSWYGYKYRCVVNGTNSKEFITKFVNKWIGAINSSWKIPVTGVAVYCQILIQTLLSVRVPL